MNARNKSLTAFALTLCLAAPMATPAVLASEEGHRNTAIGLGVASAALLLTQKNKLPGALLGAGALVAEINHEKAIDQRHRDERDWDRNDRDRWGRDDRYRRDREREERIRFEREREERIRREREREERLRREREERWRHEHSHDRHDHGDRRW